MKERRKSGASSDKVRARKPAGCDVNLARSHALFRGGIKPEWLDMRKPVAEWRLADAKNRFSEFVNRALSEGPQRVLRRQDSVIVVAEREFEKIARRRPSFKEFLMAKGPTLEGIDLTRDRSPMRDVYRRPASAPANSSSYRSTT